MMSAWRLLLAIATVLFLTACAPDEAPGENAQPLRGWDGEEVDGQLVPSPDALALVTETTISQATLPQEALATTSPTTALPPATSEPEVDQKQSLIDAYLSASTSGASGESIIPWISTNCRASLGLAGESDPLNAHLLDSFQLDAEREVDRAIVNGTSGAVIVIREDVGRVKVPTSWTREGDRWLAGSCEPRTGAYDFATGQPNSAEGLQQRLDQLEAVRRAGELTQYPWLSQRCRERSMFTFTQTTLLPELVTGTTDYWSFANVTIQTIAGESAVTSSVDPTNAQQRNGQLAARWVYENGNWHYDSCKQPGGNRLYLGSDGSRRTIDELHGGFIESGFETAFDGLTQSYWSQNEAEYETLMEIGGAISDNDAEAVLQATLVPALTKAGYVLLGEVDGEYRFVLRSDPCGAATTWVQLTSGGLALELHYGDC